MGRLSNRFAIMCSTTGCLFVKYNVSKLNSSSGLSVYCLPASKKIPNTPLTKESLCSLNECLAL